MSKKTFDLCEIKGAKLNHKFYSQLNKAISHKNLNKAISHKNLNKAISQKSKAGHQQQKIKSGSKPLEASQII